MNKYIKFSVTVIGVLVIIITHGPFFILGISVGQLIGAFISGYKAGHERIVDFYRRTYK